MKIIMLLFSMMLVGCAMAPPTQSAINGAHFDPLPATWQADMQGIIEKDLRDPDTARFRSLTPRKGFVNYGPSSNKIHYWGYIIPVYVNVKNGFGTYTGEQLYSFIYSGGKYIPSAMLYPWAYIE